MAFTLDDLTRYDLQLYAIVDYDQQLTNVTAFQSSFAVNTIPSATVSFAVGRVVKGTGKDQPNFWDNATTGRPIEVWAKYRDPNAPDKFRHQLLFLGETAGQAITKTPQSVTYAVTIRHWLAWLDEGSAYSPNVAPGSASNATFPATAAELVIKATDGAASTPGGSLVAKIATDGPLSAFVADVWGKLIRPFLQYVAKENPLHEDLTGQTRVGATLELSRLQRRVLFALDRLYGKEDSAHLSTLINGGLPFRTRDGNTIRIDEAYLVGKLADALLQRDAEQLSNNTMWSKITGEYAPALLAEVWPHIDFARVCPSVGAVRGLSNQISEMPDVTLTAKDILQIELVAEVNRELRAVLITRPEPSLTNVPVNSSPTRTTAANYAMFIGQPTGLILVKQAPDWLIFTSKFLDTTAAPNTNAPGTGQPAAANENVPAKITTMDEPDPAAAEKLKQKREKAVNIVKDAEGLAEAYAQQLYNNEVLRGRQVQLMCPFTTKICPGAPIRFETTIDTSQLPDDATAAQKAAARDVFLGKVVQVTSSIDLATKTAGTSLLVSHVRTTYEDSLAQYSVEKPAIYEQNATNLPLASPKLSDVLQPDGASYFRFWDVLTSRKPEESLFPGKTTTPAVIVPPPAQGTA